MTYSVSVTLSWVYPDDMSLLLIRLGGICLLQTSIHAIVVGFTPPSSFLRPAFLPVVIYCVYAALPLCLEATGTILGAGLTGAFSISSLFQYLDTALLSRWSADVLGPTRPSGTYDVSSKQKGHTSVRPNLNNWQRLRFGFQLSVSTRKAGTPYQVKGISPPSTENAQYLPSRESFLVSKLVQVLISYLILDLSTLASQPDQNQVLYHHARISWRNFDNLTPEHLSIRIATTLGFWLDVYCIIQCYMGFFALVAVGSGASKVEYWPPGFGNVSEAYSIRRFWG